MLKKEITSVLRSTRSILILMVFQVLMLTGVTLLEQDWLKFREMLLFGPQLMLFLYPLLLGISLFSEEMQQKGMEYLLSMPYTRLQIVWTKLLVRLAALILIFIPFFILFNANPLNSILFPVLSFSIAYFVFFMISFSISFLQENSLVDFVLASFFAAAYLVLVFLVYRLAFILAGPAESNISTVRDLLNLEKVSDITMNLNISPWVFWFILLILLLPFLAAFFRTVRKFDLRQSRSIKAFAWTFGLTMPLAFFAAFGLVYATLDWSAYNEYYLSSSKHLLEIRWTGTMRFHDQKGSKKISIPGQLFADVLGEKDGRIYIISRQRKGDELLQLQESRGEWQSLYQCPEGFHLGYSNTAGSFGRDIFVLETPKNKQGGLRLLIYDTFDRKLRRVKFGAVQWSHGYQMIGAGRANGKSFVLISPYRKSNMPVQRLWEDGLVEKLAGTEHSRCLYLGDKLLIDGKEGVKVFSLTTTDQPKLEKTFPELIIPGWYHWRDRDEFDFFAALAAKEILLSRKKGQNIVLNLQTYDQKPVSLATRNRSFHALSWPFYRANIQGGFSILRLQDGRLETLGSILYQFKKTQDEVWFSNGIVTRQNKKVRAYAFPDLRELIFPDL